MRLFQKTKDGGPESPVDAFFLFESKRLGSVALLRFNKGGREAYHTHAFHALTWFFSGDLTEENYDGTERIYRRSLIPKFTSRTKNHRVRADSTSWCFTVRGPWNKTWTEHKDDRLTMFGWGRKVLSQKQIESN